MGLVINFSSGLTKIFQYEDRMYGFGFETGNLYFLCHHDPNLERTIGDLFKTWIGTQEVNVEFLPYIQVRLISLTKFHRIFVHDKEITYDGPPLGDDSNSKILELFLSLFSDFPEPERIARYFHFPDYDVCPIDIWVPFSVLKNFNNLKACQDDIVKDYIPRILYILESEDSKPLIFKNIMFRKFSKKRKNSNRVPRILVTTKFLADWLTHNGHLEEWNTTMNAKTIARY